MQYAWTAPIIPILQSPDTPVEIAKADIVWLENIYMIGALGGLPVTIFSVGKFGRKNSILIASVQNLISWIIIAVAPSIEYLYVARFISGMASVVGFVSAPMYIGEIADQKIRGFLGAFIYLMMLIGIIVVYSVAPFVSIPVSSAVGASFLILQLITFPFMPETPYYLLLKGKTKEARKSLQRLRSKEDVETELAEIQKGVERQSQETGRFVDLFLVDSNRKGLLIMTLLNAAQHFSSFSVMLMNFHTILADADSILTPNTAAIVFSVILMIAAMASAATMDKAGRIILLSVSSILTGISLVVLAAYFTVKNAGTDITAYNWVPVLAVMVFAATFKYGLGMVPIVLTAELFPTSVKAKGMTLSNSMYVVFSIASVYVFQELGDLYGMHVPFYIFAASCFLTALFSIFYIPETKGKTLEEIQMILKGIKPNLIQRKLSTRQKMEGIVNEACEVTIL